MIPALIVQILLIIINLLIVVLIVQAVVSWLVAFQIVNPNNPGIETIWRFTRAITDPLLKPIRRFIPPVSGVDLSPLVLILILYILQQIVPYLLLT